MVKGISEVSKLQLLVNSIGEITFILFCTFIFPIHTFSLAAIIIVHTPSQATNGKSTFMIEYRRLNADSGGIQTSVASTASLIGFVVSIFRQKMDGPNLYEKDIKVPSPAPTIIDTQIDRFRTWRN